VTAMDSQQGGKGGPSEARAPPEAEGRPSPRTAKDSIIVVDTETTSRYKEEAHVVEIAAVVIVGGKVAGCFSSLSDPGQGPLTAPGSREALAVSGITRAQLLENAPKERRVRQRWHNFLTLWDPTIRITSYNVAYDYAVLHQGHWSTAGHPWGRCIMLRAFDTMAKVPGALQARAGGARLKWPKLSEAAEFCNVRQGQTHRALEDAQIAAQVWLTLREREREVEPSDR